jgi:hypothetical protein
MKHSVLLAASCALAIALAPTAALSKGNGGGNGHGKSAAKLHSSVHSNKGGALRGLARADASAGTHGLKGRNNARLHGANNSNFCPPGQAKKPGLGSRFQC